MTKMTRVFRLGSYTDINNDEYTLYELDEKKEKHVDRIIKVDNPIYIDGVKIMPVKKHTRSGQGIIVLVDEKGAENPLFGNVSGYWATTKGAVERGIFHRFIKRDIVEKSFINRGLTTRRICKLQDDDFSMFRTELMECDSKEKQIHLFKRKIRACKGICEVKIGVYTYIEHNIDYIAICDLENGNLLFFFYKESLNNNRDNLDRIFKEFYKNRQLQS